MNVESPIPRADLLAMIADQIPEVYPDYSIKKTDALAARVLEDLHILARCAISRCRVTYTDAITLRGYGNRQNGRWLDDVYRFAISPLGFPDLTMLVVNAATGQPSEDAFEARRSKLREIQISEVPRAQNRCVWFDAYEAVLGPLEPIPTEYHYARSVMPEPPLEAEIRRAVSNAIQRVNGVGKMTVRVGKEYVGSGNYSELCLLTSQLLNEQKGRCALTGQPFETRSAVEGGIQDDRMSLDRIDNSFGYYDGNVQLVTQFANRARGQMSIQEARRRLIQYVEP
ncbi:hypothetical protein [Phaeobacter inhibens]|uniref:hypothetical protein n=1 Tax=Phaeobacter inhibens TaxID=221822 RepID=UPI0021A95F5E|nr:hypothetical protein [Phaeobacter inhibens]UWR45388.1 hypothetical protein K4F86_00975 [Phaeobacter inhibens]